ncbi:hypothetical protein B9Z19DRAFT_121444 [Tuber borchii]|uniref:Uncharacterized protein n=1 Tax=Tuber borchii TaxID=42251 RepID=A0A2T6ZRB0_TUBBO|nr:hypothetical protein B9Z19DRAFT_121444 [Tuber borchii]
MHFQHLSQYTPIRPCRTEANWKILSRRGREKSSKYNVNRTTDYSFCLALVPQRNSAREVGGWPSVVRVISVGKCVCNIIFAGRRYSVIDNTCRSSSITVIAGDNFHHGTAKESIPNLKSIPECRSRSVIAEEEPLRVHARFPKFSGRMFIHVVGLVDYLYQIVTSACLTLR